MFVLLYFWKQEFTCLHTVAGAFLVVSGGIFHNLRNIPMQDKFSGVKFVGTGGKGNNSIRTCWGVVGCKTGFLLNILQPTHVFIFMKVKIPGIFLCIGYIAGKELNLVTSELSSVGGDCGSYARRSILCFNK